MSANVSQSSSATSQRKSMRKGTHSCFECRKRKIRCIFRLEDSTVCVPCKGRGSECTEQRRELIQSAAEKSKTNLKERVAKLEAIIEASGLSARGLAIPPTVVNAVDDPSSSPSGADKATPKSTESAPVDTESPHDVDPIVNLFNNAIWRRNSPEDDLGGGSNRQNAAGFAANNADLRVLTKRLSTREMLLSVLPVPELLGDILNATFSWWNTWKPLGPWLSDADIVNRPKSLQEFVLWAFSSDNPTIVGLAILCVALSIQQLDHAIHGSIICRLPRLQGELVQEYYELVDRLIVNDSEFASSREGIEVILMSGKILVNLGLIKKSWILNHRAVSYAQLLGYHRPQRLSLRESDVERARRHRAWLMISQSDVVLSMILGLPYATDGKTIPTHMLGETGTLPFFQHKLVTIAARVVDKSQMGLALSVQITQDIQNDLSSIVSQMPEHFWDAKSCFANGQITETEYRDLVPTHNFYHLIRIFLHMPLMIQSVDDPLLAPHREACLDAARDALKLYKIMRSESGSTFSMIKLIDYEAFICSSLLLLGVMGYGNPQFPVQSTTSERDLGLVQSTLEILREASKSSNNAIATQAVQGLQSLTALADKGSCPRVTISDHMPYARIVVPYSGTITISPGPYLKHRHSIPQQPVPNPGPIFKLSHGVSELFPTIDQNHISAALINTNDEGVGMSNNDGGGGGMIADYPSIDFDWGNMINMNAEEDWAWLMDVNNNGVSGIL